MSIFGFFDSAEQITPAFDPGMAALCPFCLIKLEVPLVTTSVFLPGDDRSFFYRAHKVCENEATREQIGEIEGSLVDARAAKQG